MQKQLNHKKNVKGYFTPNTNNRNSFDRDLK